MLGQRVVQSLGDLSIGGELSEVGGCDITFKVLTEIGTTGLVQRTCCTDIDLLPFLEFHL